MVLKVGLQLVTSLVDLFILCKWHMVAGVLTDTDTTQYTTGPEGTFYHLYNIGTKAVVEEIAVLP